MFKALRPVLNNENILYGLTRKWHSDELSKQVYELI